MLFDSIFCVATIRMKLDYLRLKEQDYCKTINDPIVVDEQFAMQALNAVKNDGKAIKHCVLLYLLRYL